LRYHGYDIIWSALASSHLRQPGVVLIKNPLIPSGAEIGAWNVSTPRFPPRWFLLSLGSSRRLSPRRRRPLVEHHCLRRGAPITRYG